MLNKLSTLFVLLSFLTISNAYSQGSFSINFGGSYGFGIFENSVETFVNTKQEENAYFTENKKFSLGGGMGLSGGVMYHFQENFGIGLGFFNQFNNEEEFVEVNAVSGVVSTNTRTLSAKRFSIRPSLQVNTAFDKLNTYLQMGVSFNSTKQKLDELVVVDTMRTIFNWEYEGHSGVGFFATWGVTYNITDHILLNLGLNLEIYQYIPDHNYLVGLNNNGHDANIANMPKIYTSVDFVDWVSDQYNQYPDPEIPHQLPKQTFTYNSLNINLGIAYRF